MNFIFKFKKEIIITTLGMTLLLINNSINEVEWGINFRILTTIMSFICIFIILKEISKKEEVEEQEIIYTGDEEEESPFDIIKNGKI